ncbi:glutaredoxin 3 [Parvularcula sp. ZS-1/3]|uniref:Glutaredoxin n=1 Tax=Parvularcula mediterranea TaxID=2732508 RepID=A0A7Y3RML4_9PROT|nr:glutaredoxin 3 [Parvularcula mediterranea]NNU16361.1 glutaredoxin 3 [Parvularcula mediterranea]
MAKVTVYTKMMCPYCIRALDVLKKKGAEIEDIPAAFDKAKKQEMIERSGGRMTFPQIFINDEHIGGCDDLLALDRAGKLDAKLAA